MAEFSFQNSNKPQRCGDSAEQSRPRAGRDALSPPVGAGAGGAFGGAGAEPRLTRVHFYFI